MLECGAKERNIAAREFHLSKEAVADLTLSKLAFAAIVFVFWRFVFVFVLLVVGCLRGGLWVLAMPTSR